MLSLISNWNDPNTIECLELGNIEIDVTISEKHNFKNSIPRYPVENGLDISDNIRQSSPVLILTGLTSNTPIIMTSPARKDENGIIRIIRDDYTNRVQQTFNYLIKCAGYSPVKQPDGEIFQKENKPKILTIVTGLMIYRNMAITFLDFPRDRGTGESLPYSITFEYVRKVNSQYSTKPVSTSKAADTDKKAQKTDNKGKKKGETVTDSLILKGATLLNNAIHGGT